MCVWSVSETLLAHNHWLGLYRARNNSVCVPYIMQRFWWHQSYGKPGMPKQPRFAKTALFLRLESCANTNMSQIVKTLQ